MRPAFAAAAFPLVAVLACSGSEPAGRWAGTTDTTASGAIVVRNTGPGIWDSATAWRLEEEMRIGSADDSGPGAISNPRFVEADAAGRVYVIEDRPNEVRVYASDGRYLRTLMRTGSGPDEVRFASGLAWDPAGHLWVVDQGNGRCTVLDTSGARLAERRMPGTHVFSTTWEGGMTRAGEIVEVAWIFERAGASRLGAENRESELLALVRLDSGLTPVDTLLLPRWEGPVFRLARRIDPVWVPVPLTPSVIWDVDPRGYAWSSFTELYRIVQQTLRGDTVRVVEREVAPVAVTSAEKDGAVAGMRSFVQQGGVVDRSLIPDVKPPISRLWVDDLGYLWTARAEPEGAPTGTLLDVFDPEGRYLGSVRAPLALQFALIRGAALYAVATDEDDAPVIVRFRIRGR